MPRDAVISTWSNFTVRVLSLVLSLSYLGPLWTTVFVGTVLSLAAVLLHHSSVPARFQVFTTWVVSLTTTTLVVENISLRERGRDTARSAEEKEQIRRCLVRHSLLNLALFTAYSGLVTWLISDHQAGWYTLRAPTRLCSLMPLCHKDTAKGKK